MYLESERSNRTALLLAKERYDALYAPFVNKKPERMAYIKHDIARLVKECSAEVGADEEYVSSRFNEYLADKSKPKHEDLAYKDAEGWVKFEESVEDIEHDDVANHEATETPEEASKADETYDLSQDTQKVTAYTAEDAGDLKDETTWKSCFRCEASLNPVYAQTSPVCQDCTIQLLAYGEATPGLAAPVQAVPFQCTICGQQGATQDEVRAHIEEAHQDVLQRQQQSQPQQMQQAKVAQEPVDEGAVQEEPVKVPPVGSEPADMFDTMVQELANRAAAKQFSTATQDEITSIAEQYNLSEDEVRENLVISATFGDYTATNGNMDEQPPNDLEEIDFGGEVSAHEALVPTDLVVNTVAEETATQPDLVYSMVRDRYGADLSDKYHASVSGSHTFFLPAGMAEQAPAAVESPEYDQQVGPSFAPEAI